MSIAARNAILAGGGLSAKSYVQDGLVAMWDGIENAGWGTHDAAATTWKDLVGSRNATLVGGVFTENSLYNGGSNTAATFSPAISAADSRTVEVVFGFSVLGVVVAGGVLMEQADKVDTGHEGFYGAYSTTLSGTGDIVFAGNSAMTVANFRWPLYYAYDYAGKIPYLNGITNIGTGSNYATYTYGSRNRVPSIGGYAPNSLAPNIPTGNIFRIAYYNRALTAAEIAANYAVDKARFNLT